MKRIGNSLKRIGNSLKRIGNSLKRIGKIFEKSWKFTTKNSVRSDDQTLKTPVQNPALRIDAIWGLSGAPEIIA